ncbi:MAG TPA: peptide deformylase [Patescibacteria group bacterium]
MDIITAPHQSLRQKAPELKRVDAKVLEFIKELEATLLTTSKRGVGLAAPQIDRPKYRIFTTYLSKGGDDERGRQIRTFINPRLTKVWGDPILGPDEDNLPLEGCLSIPSLYGPVPRYQKVRLEYDVIDKENLRTEADTFGGFFARVIQHELDHLNGILFTDYIKEYDLPLYQENPETGKLKEMNDRSIIELF